MRQGQEQFRIGDHKFRRVEGADQILAFREIDPGFAADGAVHLRDQCGGNMNQPHAAQVRSGGESGHVADDATTDGDNCGAAIGSGQNKLASERFDGLKVFEDSESSNRIIFSGLCPAKARITLRPQ